MSLSMYSCSIPVFIRHLNVLSVVLEKAAAYASELGIEPAVLVTGRLFPNMLPLSSQVQIACDVAKGAGMRLSGVEAPKYEDKESSFDELQTRIANTRKYLESLPQDKIDGSENKEIKLQAGPQELEFSGINFLFQWALPNLYFHVTTAYNILRHNGVELGKRDFLGGQ